MSRLLFSMGRDRVLPSALARPSGRGVPAVGVLTVAVLSLVLGLLLVGQVEFLSSLVNVGALTSFPVLHVCVVRHHLIRERSRRWVLHLVVPVMGFVIIGYALVSTDLNARIGGVIWPVVGALVLAGLWLRRREVTLDP